jgi:fluoride ion exporter CrcB/FEX
MNHLEIIGALSLTPVGILLLYVLAKPVVLKCEDWFYARPESASGREWIAEFLRTRIWYYLVVTLFLWLTSSGIGSSIARTYEKHHRIAAEEAAHRILQQLPESVRASFDAEATANVGSGATVEAGVSVPYATVAINLAGAVLVAVLARMSAVLYHPSLMRGILLGMLGISVATLTLFIWPMGLTGVVRTLAPEDPTEAGFLFGLYIVISTVCGLLADRLLRTADSWGRDVGIVVPYAGYTCIVCGKDADLELPDGSNGLPPTHVRLNAACNGSHSSHTRSGRFRRKTSGW